MDVSEVLQEFDLKKDYDAVQKGVNCAVLTYLFYTNINILKNTIETRLEEFNNNTLLYFAEFKENAVKLMSRDLHHEIIIHTEEDPLVVLVNFCIALYGQMSIVTEVLSYAREHLYKIAKNNPTLISLLY